jgi:hypothetical protein
MDVVQKPSQRRNSADRPTVQRRDYWHFLHPAAILAIALVTAAASFLTETELRSVIAGEYAIFKLLGGAALLYLIGIFFTQHSTLRRTESEARAILENNAADLVGMRAALRANISKTNLNANDPR